MLHTTPILVFFPNMQRKTKLAVAQAPHNANAHVKLAKSHTTAPNVVVID
jgi:hypothetical protein